MVDADFLIFRYLWGVFLKYSFYIMLCIKQVVEVLDMDIQKIGGFLKELRKQNNMTQEQLGERVGVTNKTVSRWETGKYMPPIECLKLLSEIYQISINEILTGEKLNEEDYNAIIKNQRYYRNIWFNIYVKWKVVEKNKSKKNTYNNVY